MIADFDVRISIGSAACESSLAASLCLGLLSEPQRLLENHRFADTKVHHSTSFAAIEKCAVRQDRAPVNRLIV